MRRSFLRREPLSADNIDKKAPKGPSRKRIAGRTLFCLFGIKKAEKGKNNGMIKPIRSISQIKQSIRSCRDKRVNVWFNPGRNKIVRYSGVLSGVYPEIFTVSPDDKSFLGKTTYSYTEILCGEVRISEEKENSVIN